MTSGRRSHSPAYLPSDQYEPTPDECSTIKAARRPVVGVLDEPLHRVSRDPVAADPVLIGTVATQNRGGHIADAAEMDATVASIEPRHRHRGARVCCAAPGRRGG